MPHLVRFLANCNGKFKINFFNCEESLNFFFLTHDAGTLYLNYLKSALRCIKWWFQNYVLICTFPENCVEIDQVVFSKLFFYFALDAVLVHCIDKFKSSFLNDEKRSNFSSRKNQNFLKVLKAKKSPWNYLELNSLANFWRRLWFTQKKCFDRSSPKNWKQICVTFGIR